MMYSSRKLNNKKVITSSVQLLKTNCLFFPGLWPEKPLLHQVDLKYPAFFHLTNIDITPVFSDNFSDCSAKIRAKNEQFLIANITEILSSIELKLHSMFIWFILNTFQ